MKTIHSISELKGLGTVTDDNVSRMQKYYEKHKHRIFGSPQYSKAATFIFDYASEYGDRHSYSENEHYCHNLLNMYANTGTNFIFTMFCRQRNEAEQRPVLEFLLSSKSPWAEGLNYSAVLRDKDHEDYPVGLICYDTEKTDIAIFMNLLIATRFVTGWGKSFFFHKFNKAGFSPEMSFALSGLFTCYGMILNMGENGSWLFNMKPYDLCMISKPGFTSSDMPFSNCGFSLTQFCNRTPKKQGKTLKNGGKTTPSNYIWDGVKTIISNASNDKYNLRAFILDEASIMSAKDIEKEIMKSKSWVSV